MLRVANCRNKIRDYFDSNNSWQMFYSTHQERYAAYYTSMYLLQDTTESLIEHRNRGFSPNPLEAYIEFWGIMQALFIQQDSISELYKAVTGMELNYRVLGKWQELRKLRNICAGHPAKKNRPKDSPLTRTFMGRDFGGYSEFTYEQWQSPRLISYPRIALGELIDEYVAEAESTLVEILSSMKLYCPNET